VETRETRKRGLEEENLEEESWRRKLQEVSFILSIPWLCILSLRVDCWCFGDLMKFNQACA
jgi:hypothetical protein